MYDNNSPLKNFSDEDTDKIASTAHIKLIQKSMGLFLLIKVNDDTLFVDKNGTHNMISNRKATLPPVGHITSAPSPNSPLSVSSVVKELECKETVPKCDVGRIFKLQGEEKYLG